VDAIKTAHTKARDMHSCISVNEDPYRTLGIEGKIHRYDYQNMIIKRGFFTAMK
jgi:hypothetical protein